MVVLRVQVLLVAVVSVVIVTGCGEDSSTSVSSSVPAGASKTDPASLLLVSGDLSNGRTADVVVPQVCGPLPVLEAEGETAVTETLESGDAQIVEAVGVFDTPGQASSAYDRLNHPKRLECIGKTIHIFSTSEVKQHEARKIPSGEEANVVRFVAFEDDGRVKGYSDVVALRVGQCTASLLIAVKDSETGTGLSGSISTAAATHLSPACEAKQ